MEVEWGTCGVVVSHIFRCTGEQWWWGRERRERASHPLFIIYHLSKPSYSTVQYQPQTTTKAGAARSQPSNFAWIRVSCLLVVNHFPEYRLDGLHPCRSWI